MTLKQIDSWPRLMAGFLFLGMSATVLTALGLQYLGGQIPCKLCLQERTPYYIGAPLMLLAGLALKRVPPIFIRLLFLAAGGLMLYNSTLSVYHAGAEWKFWLGPTDCTTAAAIIIDDAMSLLDNINVVRPASCDEASFYFLGLSLAGWNGVVSLFFALIAFKACFFKPNSQSLKRQG